MKRPPTACACLHDILNDIPYPPPSRHLEPPLSVGEVGRLHPYHGEDLPLRFTARPRRPGGGASRVQYDCIFIEIAVSLEVCVTYTQL